MKTCHLLLKALILVKQGLCIQTCVLGIYLLLLFRNFICCCSVFVVRLIIVDSFFVNLESHNPIHILAFLS
jgi:hypothetical protein